MMTINQGLKRLGYWSAIAPLLFIPCNPVLAQITPDSTSGLNVPQSYQGSAFHGRSEEESRLKK